jgi:hypothetical protein
MRDNFLKTVLSEKKLFLLGDENVLGERGPQAKARTLTSEQALKPCRATPL